MNSNEMLKLHNTGNVMKLKEILENTIRNLAFATLKPAAAAALSSPPSMPHCILKS